MVVIIVPITVVNDTNGSLCKEQKAQLTVGETRVYFSRNKKLVCRARASSSTGPPIELGLGCTPAHLLCGSCIPVPHPRSSKSPKLRQARESCLHKPPPLTHPQGAASYTSSARSGSQRSDIDSAEWSGETMSLHNPPPHPGPRQRGGLPPSTSRGHLDRKVSASREGRSGWRALPLCSCVPRLWQGRGCGGELDKVSSTMGLLR